ncbi:MalY/PatB family protein [Pseudonocardia asaccharolytica]|uniref:cysteine-S-conjugate beta-lyase n=1 Tax=Pseudonocardia asaccharolytica DSM 44247 = NBRC 16224 TaxID=1123024 RepID=A0A511D6E8_9PSEU|nr:aminotransferase class I/II-fold pyridoxal phosphate-dependent enzyme [Pseudonocardia asaccharolytica]GEL19184.1 aminotransferase [Pseudonocardia asaccharolytica DSM 44247 = NBRC 16224]
MANPFDDLDVEVLRRRRTMKWTRFGADVLAAWVAEMDVQTAEPISRALCAAIGRQEFGYPPPDQVSGLPTACSEFLATAYGWQVQPGDVRLVSDVLRGVAAAIQAFSPPGSAVVLPTPAYPPFFAVIRQCGRPVIEVPMSHRDGRQLIDLDAVAAALADGAATVLLCNPHNPTGHVATRDELAALAETVERCGGRVIADEVHAPLTYRPARHIPYPTVSAAAAAHAVTVTSASKGWNIPGLKCAQVVLSSPTDAERWDRLTLAEIGPAAPLGIAANIAAYTSGGPWLAHVLDHLDGNRVLLAELLGEHLPGIGYRIPDGTYLAWLDCRRLGVADPAAFFLEGAGVAVNPGADFGTGYDQYVRLNFATSRPLLTEIVQRMGRAAG